jgi:hypothetical protein
VTVGVLIEHMTSLCLEIAAMRKARQALRAQMRRTTQVRRVEVSEMLASFTKAQAETGRRMKTNLTSSLHRLRGDVNRLRQDVSADLVGVRQTWLGTIPGEPGVIRIPAPLGVITQAEQIEAMQEQPQVSPEAGRGREVAEEVPEAPEELGGVGTEEGAPGAAAKTEGQARKRKKRH